MATIVRSVRILAVAVIVLGFLERPAFGSSIAWQYNLLVHGAVVGTPSSGGGLTTVNIPVGTPLTIDLVFDPATVNGCLNPATEGGVYLIGLGNSNSATLNFLGYQYSAFGGIEVGVMGPCGGTGLSSGLRLFVGLGQLAASAGTLLQWSQIPGFGTLFIGGPGATAPGLLPTSLPGSPFFTGANIFSSPTAQLVVDSAQIQAVPEPASGLLVIVALGVLAAKARLVRRS